MYLTKKMIKIGGVILLMGFLFGCKEKFTISDITYLEFRYSVGNWCDARVSYQLQLEDQVYTVSIKQKGISEENADVFVVEKEFVKEIENVLNEYHVEKWNGFNKSDLNVLDGNVFDLYLKNSNNENLSAQGYMKWPKNYNEVKNELDQIFMGLYRE